MALRNFTNIATTGKLSADPGTSGTTLAMATTPLDNIPAFPFYVVINKDQADEEGCLATGGSGSSLTVTRAYNGYTASAHAVGSTVQHVVLAEHLNKTDAHVEASTAVHGITGAVVGTTDSQTLTNKILNTSQVSSVAGSTPGSGPIFQVTSNSGARDSFYHDNTGGTGRAFVVRLGGVDRFIIDGTGVLASNQAIGAGNATFNGTLSVTGASTIAALSATTGAFSSTLSVTGASTLAAISGTSATLSGNLSVTGTALTDDFTSTGFVACVDDIFSLGGRFRTQLVATNHVATLMDIPRTGGSGYINRSGRQSWVHEKESDSLGVAIGVSDTLIDELAFTVRESCELEIDVLVEAFADDSANGLIFEPIQQRVYYLITNTSNVTQFDPGRDFKNDAWASDTLNYRPVTQCPLKGLSTAFGSGTSLKLRVFGSSSTTVKWQATKSVLKVTEVTQDM